MRNLIRNKTFVVGFIFGFILFLAINFYMVNVCEHCTSRAGFPLPFYVWNVGNFNMEGKNLIIENRFSHYYIWNGIADFFIGIVFSFTIGLIFKYIWSKFTTQKLR